MELSKYQKEIFKAVEKEKLTSILIEAVAGSGKTTTILKSLDYVDNFYKVLFLAFNKGIADNLKNRVPEFVTVKTFHGFGLSCFQGVRPVVDPKKLRNIYRKQVDKGFYDEFSFFVCKLVSYAKQAGMLICLKDTPKHWKDLVEHYNLNLDPESDIINYLGDIQKKIRQIDKKIVGWERLNIIENLLINRCIEDARELLKHSNNIIQVIDFDDMVYLPLLKELYVPKYNIVYVDEAQDTNTMRRLFIQQSLSRGGRVIAVGDSRQAIFGFTGATTDAMQFIKKEFKCKEFTLPISYRCAKSIVKKASKIEPRIQADKNSPEGKVLILKSFTPAVFKLGNVVLCRNVAPLLSLAYTLLANNIPVTIIGRNIGAGIIQLIDKFLFSTLNNLIVDITSYSLSRVEILEKGDMTDKIGPFVDKVNSVLAILTSIKDPCTTKQEIITQIEHLFKDKEQKNTVIFSTIHKSKGLEWDTVFFLDSFLIPVKYAISAWQKEQETNLEYVAITRTKDTLVYINSGDLRS